jgi:hypothetical protein
MNTITKSASTSVIVAVDLCKYKSVACVQEPGIVAIASRAATRHASAHEPQRTPESS